MQLSDFSFDLPEELIAQEPLNHRAQSRLLVINRNTSELTHSNISDIAQYFRAGDVLVMNNSKVIPARLYAKKPTGGKVEIFLVAHIATTQNSSTWEALIGGHHIANNTELALLPENSSVTCTTEARITERTWRVTFRNYTGNFDAVLERLGNTPIPPYIHSTLSENELRERYQTVYAKSAGSVAAPTAGLHFTSELLEQLCAKGVITTEVTLHVGLGTFAPIRENDLSKHHMHSERAVISQEAAHIINAAKKEGRRVIAVGTTSVRTLESFAHEGRVQAGEKSTSIFIQPGYQFQIVDGILTNFHLPESTLIVLVAAFASRERILNAYKEAIANRYRFYSFGDAMLII
ncbi:MAG: tRNA preQ1(34) S-adenosylmethionine ribosyltransferase-isomerase QueA [Candidatus Kerfeldbacteria bacterium]|nr:tRNA preQ1(34) S-adenosylmethionine ribosyltransferase-isomerase QueA [Candidatus Kerfeldbacteria bacterium]